MERATSVRILNENVDKLTKYDDMVKAYDELTNEELHNDAELDLLLQRQTALEMKMQSLQSMLPSLQLVENDSKQLAGMISFTSTLAENVSSKVRQLDLAKSRVALCMQRVEDILDLKFCTDGVQTALQDEDYEKVKYTDHSLMYWYISYMYFSRLLFSWVRICMHICRRSVRGQERGMTWLEVVKIDKAAAHVHRFLSLDENVLRMSADANEGSTLDMSFKLLHEAQTKLKTIIHNKFDAAVRSGDAASVERFFKTFPLIGEHESGLAKFSKYLCCQLSETSDQKLKLALAIGPDDKRANVIYADTVTVLFEEIARIIEIHQPLVETYYGPGKMMLMIQHIQKECDRQVRNIIVHFKKNRDFERKVQSVQQSLMYQKPSTERIDPKDIDILLAEVTILNTRAELYLRFLKRRICNDLEIAIQDEQQQHAKKSEADQFLNTCELSCLMQEFIGNYIMMEEYFMRQMVIKAVNMDSLEDGSLTSSMVDDSFFIVKKCVRRALSSSSVDCVCAMLNHACTILEQDFREVLFSKLRLGFPSGFDLTQAYNLVQSSITQGRLQSADVEAEKARSAFLTTLNNAEVSCEYIQTLKSNIHEEVDKLYSGVSDQGKAKLQSCLGDLGNVSSRFKDVLEFGFAQLVSTAVKLRVKPLVEAFLSISHNISDDEFSNYEANDPWVQNFIFNLDGLLITFKNTLTTGNYDTLVSHVSNEITAQLEKVIMKATFNRLGGLQFDKELRALVGYLTSVTTWTIRDKFARLTQMATILNLERVTEILDYWGSNSGPLTWRLTPAEVRQILMLRVDFRGEDIKRLKL